MTSYLQGPSNPARATRTKPASVVVCPERGVSHSLNLHGNHSAMKAIEVVAPLDQACNTASMKRRTIILEKVLQEMTQSYMAPESSIKDQAMRGRIGEFVWAPPGQNSTGASSAGQVGVGPDPRCWPNSIPPRASSSMSSSTCLLCDVSTCIEVCVLLTIAFFPLRKSIIDFGIALKDSQDDEVAFDSGLYRTPWPPSGQH